MVISAPAMPIRLVFLACIDAIIRSLVGMYPSFSRTLTPFPPFRTNHQKGRGEPDGYGVTVRVVVLVVPARVAERVTGVWVVTFLWVTLKVAVALPARIVTVAGTVAAAVAELVRVTTRPPVGAMPLRETVPVTTVVALPLTVLGATATERSTGASTFS